MKKIAVFASGSGSNAENIIDYFNRTKTAIVTKVFCNNTNAKVFDRCVILFKFNNASTHINFPIENYEEWIAECKRYNFNPTKLNPFLPKERNYHRI